MTAALLLVLALAAAPATEPAPQEGAFRVGTATAPRGQIGRGAIEVPPASDAALTIPVAVVHGAKPGPVLAVVAGAHGTEYASIIAVERLIEQLDAEELSGTVILVPLINVPSFEQKIAHVNPVDGEEHEPFYPGKMDGTQTERASFLITREVVEQVRSPDRPARRRPRRKPAARTATGRRPATRTQDAKSREMVLAFGLDTSSFPPTGRRIRRRPGIWRTRRPARQAVDHRGGRPRRNRRTGRRQGAGATEACP